MGKKRSRRQASVIWRAGLSLFEVNSCLEVHEITDRLRKRPSAIAGQAPPSPHRPHISLNLPICCAKGTGHVWFCSMLELSATFSACDTAAMRPTRHPGVKWWL
jgi:hypothetical protein